LKKLINIKKAEKLKEEFNDDRLVIESETFDIFGNIEENNNKVKYIGSRSHREIEKSKFRIMNINKKIDVFDFTEKMQSIVNYLDGAMPKIVSKFDMPLYKLVPISKNIEENNFETYNINIENELLSYNEDDESAYNLICLNYKEGMPLLYFSNIMYFDNNNKTLPLGMNLSTRVLVDNKRLEFSLVNKTKFRTNAYFGSDGNNLKCKDIFVYEYDVFTKGEKKEEIIEEVVEELRNFDEELEENTEESESLFENIESLEDLDDLDDSDNEEELDKLPNNYIDPNEQVEEEIIEKKEENTEVIKETLMNKSKKLMKLQEKMAKELEKEQKREEKMRKKLMKKGK